MTGAVAIIAPPGAPVLTAEQLITKPGVSAFFAVAAGCLVSFLGDRRVWPYLTAGVFVIADFADGADALECERRMAAQRGAIQ